MGNEITEGPNDELGVARAAQAARRARELFADGRGDQAVAMAMLASAFPTLVGREGVQPWDAVTFWTRGVPGLSSAGEQAAAFVLGVFNPGGTWFDPELAAEQFPGAPVLAFELHHALGNWDAVHRAAFCAWAQHPWWP